MKWLAGFASVLLVFAAACNGGDNDGGSGANDKEAVSQAFEETIDALASADFDEMYGHFSSEFQARCEEEDFQRIMAIAAVFLGDAFEDVSVNVEEVRFEDDRAYVTATFEGLGDDIDAESDSDVADFWVYEDGEWKADTDDETPCDLGGDFNGDIDTGDEDEDDDEPAGPGASRSEAVALGETVESGDLAVTVADVNVDAAEQIMAGDEFASTPVAGNRYVLVTVSVEHVGDGEETLDVSTTDFKLTGSNNVVYDGFADDTSCGFIDGEVSAELFPGGSEEGFVCFQVPADEDDLILIVQPFFSFEDEDRRYMKLD